MGSTEKIEKISEKITCQKTAFLSDEEKSAGRLFKDEIILEWRLQKLSDGLTNILKSNIAFLDKF
ncbi:MAG: hypothetical protein PHX78_06440 [bacterium]|nr:hypothetical protein [bacterium]